MYTHDMAWIIFINSNICIKYKPSTTFRGMNFVRLSSVFDKLYDEAVTANSQLKHDHIT